MSRRGDGGGWGAGGVQARGVGTRGVRTLVAVAALALAAAGCAATATPGGTGSPTSAPPRPVTVFAAASLTAAFTEIGTLDPTLDVRFTFDGSPTLVDQLKGGAPADVLATADKANMRKAVEAALVEGDPTDFASNTGVMIVPTGNPAGVTGLDASLNGKKLVVCAPAVPCGAVALAIADAAGHTLRPVSEEQKVTDVRGKVASGEADAGIVFSTDARAVADEVDVVELPGADAFVSRYPIAVAKGAPNEAAARAFIDLVTGDQGQAVLATYGFTAP